MADVDNRFAFSDNRAEMTANGEFVSERGLLVLAEAAARLGINIDLAAIAPTRLASGRDTLVPSAEYQAVVRSIFADPRETLGIALARALPIESSGLWGFLLRSSPIFGDMLRRAERYIRIVFRYTRLVLAEEGERGGGRAGGGGVRPPRSFALRPA
ncbi:MAG: AraC family transcriptional regulator ligand-binding domain-containing protein [Pseudolabrys sp.]